MIELVDHRDQTAVRFVERGLRMEDDRVGALDLQIRRRVIGERVEERRRPVVEIM